MKTPARDKAIACSLRLMSKLATSENSFPLHALELLFSLAASHTTSEAFNAQTHGEAPKDRAYELDTFILDARRILEIEAKL